MLEQNSGPIMTAPYPTSADLYARGMIWYFWVGMIALLLGGGLLIYKAFETIDRQQTIIAALEARVARQDGDIKTTNAAVTGNRELFEESIEKSEEIAELLRGYTDHMEKTRQGQLERNRELVLRGARL